MKTEGISSILTGGACARRIMAGHVVQSKQTRHRLHLMASVSAFILFRSVYNTLNNINLYKTLLIKYL